MNTLKFSLHVVCAYTYVPSYISLTMALECGVEIKFGWSVHACFCIASDP